MNVEDLDHSRDRWFAIRVKSNCERLVAAMANNKGFDEFLPTYRSHRRWSDRTKSVEFPLFPGYVFCRLDPQHRLPVLTIPGVLHFVGIGKIPVPIDDAEIAALQSAVRSGLSTEPWPYLEAGQRVRLEEGPLAGMEGILCGKSKKDRLVVSVTLLKRSVAVAIEQHWVTPIDLNGRPLQARPLIPRSSPQGLAALS
jgi:transcription antitermination factor NusG